MKPTDELPGGSILRRHVDPDAAWMDLRRRLRIQILRTIEQVGRKWVSFFHVIGQAQLDCEAAERALDGCTYFEARVDRHGETWLKIVDGVSFHGVLTEQEAVRRPLVRHQEPTP